MSEETTVLPPDFNGIFPFTNSSDRDFIAKWNSIEYSFPSMKTSPMIIMGESPENIQNIRKKFARDFAIREYYLSESFNKRNNVAIGQEPALYTEADLAPYIKSCLEPLPLATATAKLVKTDVDKVFRRDEHGQPVTKVVEKNDSLVQGTPMA